MKAPITSGGGGTFPVAGTGKKPVAPAPREKDATPTDSFSPSRIALPSQETVESGAPALESRPGQEPARVERPSFDSPSTLTMLDEPAAAHQDDPPQRLTLAQLARSASQAVGRLLGGDQLKPFRRELKAINDLKGEMEALRTPEGFAAKTAEFKQRLAAGESLDGMRVEAYAVAREAARQATGMFAYDCQVLGALAMDDGHIAEMRTGEGKTLTAVLPLYLNALAGKGAHLVTVNETLAKRDADWMGPIFEKLGMTVGCVTEEQTPEEKRAEYRCDVTYVSDRALGFDFLRDRSATDPADRVQRGHFFALIDEVDEVLIDEARTPMILSGPAGEASPDYGVFATIVKDLVPGEDFKIEEEKRTAWLTDGGLRYVENELTQIEARAVLSASEPGSPEAAAARRTIDGTNLLRAAIRRENAAERALENSGGAAGAALQVATRVREQLAARVDLIDLYAEQNCHRIHYLDAALKARALFIRGRDYTVQGGELKIVDANKGRVSDGKRYSNGLHQALEAKEGLPVGGETRTVSTITMPELVAQYQRKAGMTGTGKSSEREFLEFYDLDVVEIPTNKPVIRVDQPDIVFAGKEAKMRRVVEEAIGSALAGRPVLVGTASVNSNREVAARLLDAGWPADRLQILNAETVKGGEDHHDPNAGRSGTITLTTGDRAALVQPDAVNYKKIAFVTQTAAAQGKPVLVETESEKDAVEVRAWLSGSVPLDPQHVQIRVRGDDTPIPAGAVRVEARDYGSKPVRLQMDELNAEEVLSRALRAFNDGEPVILESATAKGMGEAAQQLLDRGLGLGAIPMVCDGKEKENVTIELAGRSGVITVATNMAGRGADIKPDLVAIERISEAAYEKAVEGQPVVVSVRKESQALKIGRLLGEHVPVVRAGEKGVEPKPGQVLLKVEREPAGQEGGVLLRGDDFKTGGLYVIGTERSTSRRIDDQLIGRAGRQGAEGTSRFFLSLEDDLPRIFGGESFEPLLALFGSGQDGVTSSVVNEAMRSAQERVEGQHFEQRKSSARYDKVARVQRETFHRLREDVLTDEASAVDFAIDRGTAGLADLVREKLGERAGAVELARAVEGVGRELKVPLSLTDERKLDKEDLEAALRPQVERLFTHPSLSRAKLKNAALAILDRAWQEHLEEMDRLRDGIHLQAVGGREPDELFAERGFELFEATVGKLDREVATRLLEPAARLAR